MNEILLRKGLVCGIIMLFAGAGIAPSISGNIGNSCNNPCITLSQNKEPFDIESKGSNVEQETVTDPTGDVMHWYFNGSEWNWEYNVADKSNIDVIELFWSINGDKLILTMKVAGIIEISESVAYYECLNTSDSVYYICGVEGEGTGMAFNEDEEIYDFDPEVIVSGNTLSCIFDIVGEDYSNTELWGYAAEYVEAGDITQEWWGDWAPDEYAPDGGDGDGDGDGDGEEETIVDPSGDVYVFDIWSEDLEVTDEKPNIDIKQITYAKNTGSTEVTLTIEVYGEIEDKGDLESEDMSSLNLVSYGISLSTSQDSYEINYINKTCQLSYSDYTTVNITDFSVDGGTLTIQFDVLNASETYDDILANTVELVFAGNNISYYMDIAPNEPMSIDAGGPYTGEVGDDINFSGYAYFGTPPYTYEWDFGNGESSTEKNPTHAYENAGNYIVTLTVTDDEGSTANDTTTATITEKDTIPPTIQLTCPERAFYICNKKVMPFLTTIIVGSINIEVQASDYESGIDCVEFYIDNELKKTDNLAPYSWMWNEHTPFRFRHTIKAVAYDTSGNSAVKEADVWKFFGVGLKNEKTTFYFKDVLNFEEAENDSMYSMLALVSESHPTKIVDSKYPPGLFKMDTSKILPRYNLNSEELLIWYTNWIFYFMWDEYKDLFEGFELLELLFPHPSRIVEAYEYNGNEQVEIKGDVVFDLYFSSEISSKFLNKDHVKIGLYSVNPESLLPFPKLIMNKTIIIKPNLLRGINEQKIKLRNINYTLDPGELLLFQVEIIPSNKTIVNLIKNRIDIGKIFDRWEERANRWENSRINGLREIAVFINEIRNLSEGINISKEDIAEIANVVRSISLVYDSVSHPSSVTIPFKLLDDSDRNDGGGSGGQPPPTNQPPVANASASQTTGFVGEPIFFDGSLSYDPDGSIVSYTWNFGDGAIGDGKTTTHSYTCSGSYSVTLNVSDGEGATDEDTINVVIENFENTYQKKKGNDENFEDIGQWSVFHHDNSIFKSKLATPLHNCIKKDAQGTTHHSYNIGYSVQETNDTGYIICGYTGNLECFEGFLIKTDSHGYESWNKTFRVKCDTMFYSVEQTADKGYIVAGTTYDGLNGTYEAFLLKTDDQGNKMWDKTYNVLELTMGTTVRQTNDGGYILSGITGRDSSVLLIKTDSYGKKIWAKTFEFEHVTIWDDVQQTADGGYIVGGTIGVLWEDESFAFLLRTDEYGNEMWNKTFSVMNYTLGYSVKQTEGEGFIIVGYSYPSSFQNVDMMIIKTDDLGIEEWRKTYDESIGFSVEQTSDNGFIVGGAAVIQDESYALLLKTDKYGNKIWDKTYSGIGEAQGTTVIQTEDKGYILTGITIASSWLDSNIIYTLLLKTNNSGNEQWCRSFNVADITPGYVKFYGWDVSNSSYKVTVAIGHYKWSCGSSSPIGYYDTSYIGLCPGRYFYSISWSGKEATCGVLGYVNVSAGEYKEIRQNLTFCDDLPKVDIVKPEKAVYISNKSIIPFFTPVIIGDIEITVNASDLSSGIDCVKFYIDGELQLNDEMEPYCIQWDKKSFGRHTLEVVAFDKVGYHKSDRMIVWKFF
jgi:PKD repeat protein